jgi:1-acyl-sn-glycerol-3-phosphate acyltransferase
MLLLLCVMGLAVSRLKFEENIMALLPTSEAGEQTVKVLETVQFTDKTILLVEGKNDADRDLLRAYAQDLESFLLQNKVDQITQLQLRADEATIESLLELVQTHLPLYLDEADYALLQHQTHKDSIASLIERTYNEAMRTGGSQLQQWRQDPFGLTWMALRKFEQLQAGQHFHLDEGYLFANEGSYLMGFIRPKEAASETSLNKLWINQLRQGMDSLNLVYEGQAKGAYFGATPMAVANADQIKKDIQFTLSIAVVLLIALFYYFYRRLFVPIVAFLPAVFGSLLGLTVLYLLKGTISAISIGIGSVLLGLTLDYSLHILSHYRSTGDIAAMYRSIARPLLMCAVFTAVDFLCLLFLRSAVLQDLGVFAAISVSGSAFFALWMIPHLYKPEKTLLTQPNTLIDRFSRYPMQSLTWVIPGIALLLLSIFTSRQVGFNNDLEQLQYKPKDLEATQLKLETLQQDTFKSLYLISHAEDMEAALTHNHQLAKDLASFRTKWPELQIQTIAQLVPSTEIQQQQIDRWHTFWSKEKVKDLQAVFLVEGQKYGFKDSTFEPFWATLNQAFEPKILYQEDVFKDLFLMEYIQQTPGLATVMTTLRIPEKEAADVIQTFGGQDHLVVLDRKQVQEQLLNNLEKDFDQLVWMTSIAILLVIFLFFGSLELTLITNIPIFAGWFITLGLMGLLGIHFNAFNIIIATLIFGLGVDYAIFMTRGLIERYTFGHQHLPIYKSGILLSALATLLCFGILILAKHPAIQSIAAIPLIGLLVVVYMSFTLQPALFGFYIERSQAIGNAPRTLKQIIWTIFTFGYFFLGSLLISLLARFILILTPNSQNTAPLLHRWMNRFFRSLMWRTPGCPITLEGKYEDLFEKPVILIANHTSQLDTPTIGMLHDRLIFMVNDRVIHSKFFGKAIQKLGYHSADLPYEENLESLAQKIKEGYSIVIFPEGTRSRTAEIGRFHKGAFYLSEQLKVDILPVLVHGNTDVLPKNDNVLKPGPLTIQFLPKIRHDDLSWGSTYQERTKKVLSYFRSSFVSLRQRLEGPSYFAEKERACFRYKPRTIRQKAWQEFDQHKERYHWLCRTLPRSGIIHHYGCRLGVLSRLLVYDASQRRVLAWDADQEMIAIAQQTFATKRYPVTYTDEYPPLSAPISIIADATEEQLNAVLASSTTLCVCIDPPADARALASTLGRKVIAQHQGILIFGEYASQN